MQRFDFFFFFCSEKTCVNQITSSHRSTSVCSAAVTGEKDRVCWTYLYERFFLTFLLVFSWACLILAQFFPASARPCCKPWKTRTIKLLNRERGAGSLLEKGGGHQDRRRSLQSIGGLINNTSIDRTTCTKCTPRCWSWRMEGNGRSLVFFLQNHRQTLNRNKYIKKPGNNLKSLAVLSGLIRKGLVWIHISGDADTVW